MHWQVKKPLPLRLHRARLVLEVLGPSSPSLLFLLVAHRPKYPMSLYPSILY